MTDAPERIWVLKIATAPEVHMSSQALVWTQPASDSLGEDVEYVRADLAKPKVKPLVWSHWHTHKTTGRETWKAYGVGITYVVRETAGGVSAEFGFIQSNFSTVDEAQAAAQADYERRILDALEENND